jgi:hypothetical protein
VVGPVAGIDAEEAGGLGFLAAGAAQGALEQVALEVGDAALEVEVVGVRGDLRLDVRRRDLVALGEDALSISFTPCLSIARIIFVVIVVLRGIVLVVCASLG